ncbi:uncharacterized protein LOC132563740 [Ylistrum balloti]|uniref:uncharacterized protein LOC132563740 n=1 Tax=Ylistrum balloti TaxID=509963 RepID=UPI00290586EC|nr:uncharacterized protein LOC132563740 [Ylistrum balloti]
MASRFIFLTLLIFLVEESRCSTRRPEVNTLQPGATTQCLVPFLNPSRGWKKESFPNPRVNVTLCGRECTQSWVCDPSGILNTRDADILDEKIDIIASNGICGCRTCLAGTDGYKIGVALVRKMEIGSFAVVDNVDKDNLAMEFSAYLRSVSWKYGKCDDSIVIFYSQEDRKVMTSTGERVKQVLSINCTGAIFNEAKPMLRNDHVFEALEHMVTRYGQVLRTGECYPSPEPVELSIGMVILIVIICFFVLVAAVIGGVCGWRRTHGGYHRGRSNDPDSSRGDPEKIDDEGTNDPDKSSGDPEKFRGGETGDGGGVAGGSF